MKNDHVNMYHLKLLFIIIIKENHKHMSNFKLNRNIRNYYWSCGRGKKMDLYVYFLTLFSNIIFESIPHQHYFEVYAWMFL